MLLVQFSQKIFSSVASCVLADLLLPQVEKKCKICRDPVASGSSGLKPLRRRAPRRQRGWAHGGEAPRVIRVAHNPEGENSEDRHRYYPKYRAIHWMRPAAACQSENT